MGILSGLSKRSSESVVTGDVDVTSVIPGVGATNLGKAEDELHTDGDTGVMGLAVRNDTQTSICNADGDYTPQTVDDKGATWVHNGTTGEVGSTTNVHEPAVNTAAIVTKAAAAAGICHVLGLAGWSYDLLPTAGSLTIEDGAGNTIFKVDIPESGPGFLPFVPGLKGTAATALVVTLAAGGAGVSGIVSLHTWTEPT